MPTAALIGSNRGLGLGFARQLLAEGFDVHATVRNPDQCSELKALSTGGGSLKIYPLEVADAASRLAFAQALGNQPVDLLIHNAGVYGPRQVPLGTIPEDTWKEVLAINTIAPILMAELLLPQLRAADNAKIGILTSRVGSIADNGSGASYIYRSAKAGLNAAGRSLAIDLAKDGISVILLHPGWVQTDMGGASAPLEIPESILGMMEQLRSLNSANSGRFIDWSGEELPW